MTQEQADQLKWLYQQWSQVTLPDGSKTLRGYFGDIFNTVGGADAHVQAVKAELDLLEQQVSSAQPPDLTGLKAAVDALSKHLGVGTP